MSKTAPFGRLRTQERQQQRYRYPRLPRYWKRIPGIWIAIGIVSCVPATECFGARPTPLSTTASISTPTSISTTAKGLTTMLPAGARRNPGASVGQRKAVSADHEAAAADPPLGYVLKKRNPYDVHVYYSTPGEREAALVLREKLRDEFGDWMRFYPPKDRPIGPHPVPMWEADFGGYEHRQKLPAVCEFLERENTNPRLSVLIHPHSTDGDYADHTEHAFWDGPVLPLRIGGWRR